MTGINSMQSIINRHIRTYIHCAVFSKHISLASCLVEHYDCIIVLKQV